MKEEILLNELYSERKKIDARISKGEEIIKNLKRKKRQEEIENTRAKIDDKTWDDWLLKLLKRMEFECIFYGDRVSIGVSGKRPFGNSSINEDIAKILGWNDDKNDLSEEQYLLIEKLWQDLPIFLNKLISNIK